MIWFYLIALAFLYVMFRRGTMRKVGEAVGRAKATSFAQPGSGKQFSKTETGIGADYSALDLKPGASYDEVKKAYRELAKVWHPDRFGDDAKLKARANVKLGEINAAYERLKNHFGK